MSATAVVLLALLALACAGLAFLFYQLQRSEAKHRDISVEQATLQARLDAIEQISDPEAVRKEMGNVFKALAQETLEAQSEQTAQRAQSDLGLLLKPVQKEVGEFRKRVEDLLQENVSTKTMLEEKFKLMDTSVQNLSDDANELSAALRGSAKVRGDWGELNLVRALEAVGLREGADGGYELQLHFNVDGGAVRPDAVLHLPGDRHVAIDAKVSLVAYANYVATENEQQRAESLSEMEKAMDKQVSEIHERYLDLPGLNTLGFALMFTPLEPAWQLAMENFPGLFDKARKKGVIITGPTTLMATLRLVEQIWQADRSAKSVRDIVERAESMQDAVNRMLANVDETEKHINRAGETLQSLQRSMTGRQGVVHHAIKLQELGARGKNDLPADYVETAKEDNYIAEAAGEAKDK